MKKILLIIGLLSISINAQTAGNGFTDVEGNQYATVIIGNQEWMATNLRTTKYNNGQSIQYQSLGTANNEATARYFKANNNDNNIIEKGLLYNWFAINNVNFVPNIQDGWHIPTQAEWNQLITTVNSINQPVPLIKSNGSLVWNCSTTSNQYNFDMLPTGMAIYNANSIFNLFYYGTGAYFWTNESYIGSNSYAYAVSFQCSQFNDVPALGTIYGWDNKYYGRSIRLVRNVSLSTNQFDKSDIKVYPNPVQNKLNIESQEIINDIEIFDLLGKKILESKSKTIDVSGLQSGIYLLKINTNQGSSTQKIIKQ